MANLNADELKQVQYALRTYGGAGGARLADELGTTATAQTQPAPAGQQQQQQSAPDGGQQENAQEA